MEEEKCPCCPNHCEKDHLGCGCGKDYFSNSHSNSEPKTLIEQVITDLRKCGHTLHHHRELDSTQFLSALSEEELNKLHELLSKICNNRE